MCGIIGIMGKEDVAPRLLEGLKRLEYRGYDSSGLCTLFNGALIRERAEGKLLQLEDKIRTHTPQGSIGIAHTRWATHGAPTERNAHPHATPHVAMVHNGIIENFRALRQELTAAGCHFESETDSEVIVQMISRLLDSGVSPTDAVPQVLQRLHGAFALAFLFKDHDDMMIGARRGSPLVIGYGEGEMYLGSDALALATLSNRVCYLEEGDWVVLTRTGARIFDAWNKPVLRPIVITNASSLLMDKGKYRHYMQKEIFEQPTVIGHTLSAYIHSADAKVSIPQGTVDLSTIQRILIIACGTSYYAALTAQYWFEDIAGMPVETAIASEFRYRHPVLEKNTLALFISQSGETADTLAALHYCKSHNISCAAIVNVDTSSIARAADIVFPTHAGPEIGVASTKGFTCQLIVLATLAIGFARLRGAITPEAEHGFTSLLYTLPARMNEALARDGVIARMAYHIAKARDALYLGRGTAFPLALEGALKLKEISYIHAEGYAAGEMKHGPIALVDENMPVIVLAPSGPLFDKTISNMQEVIARGGRVLLISDQAGLHQYGQDAWSQLDMPLIDAFLAPILYAIPIQLLAYHVAVIKGTDVDQPRNLAKSVTVE